MVLSLAPDFERGVGGSAAFRLIAGADDVSDDRFGSSIHHLICKTCGVSPFGRGHLDMLGDDF